MRLRCVEVCKLAQTHKSQRHLVENFVRVTTFTKCFEFVYDFSTSERLRILEEAKQIRIRLTNSLSHYPRGLRLVQELKISFTGFAAIIGEPKVFKNANHQAIPAARKAKLFEPFLSHFIRCFCRLNRGENLVEILST